MFIATDEKRLEEAVKKVLFSHFELEHTTNKVTEKVIREIIETRINKDGIKIKIEM